MASMFSRVPDWVTSLREQSGELPPLQWLDAAASDTSRGTILEAWDAVPFDDEFKEACRKRVARSIPVASGAPRKVRLTEAAEVPTLLFDPERPDGLFAALGRTLPSVLWVPLGQTTESIGDALAPYLAAEARSVHVLSRVERIFKGTAGQLGLRSVDDFGRAIAALDPWIDVPFWSNAEDDDPWPVDTSSLSMMKLRALLDDCRQQIPIRYEARSWRSLWSRSVLRIERHPFDAFVIELRYEPSRHPEVMRELEGYFPFKLAEDMPVDLAASLLRGPTVTRAFLAEALAREGTVPFLALASCALAPGEPTTAELLREMLLGEHGQVAVELAAPYGFRGLLLEALATTRDLGMREDLERLLDPGGRRSGEDEEGEA